MAEMKNIKIIRDIKFLINVASSSMESPITKPLNPQNDTSLNVKKMSSDIHAAEVPI